MPTQRNIEESEPTLTLRGRSRLAALVVKHYAALLEFVGAPEGDVRQAAKQADEMSLFHERWARAQAWKPNATVVKEVGNGGFSLYRVMLEKGERVQIVDGNEYHLSVVREDGVQIGLPTDYVTRDAVAAP